MNKFKLTHVRSGNELAPSSWAETYSVLFSKSNCTVIAGDTDCCSASVSTAVVTICDAFFPSRLTKWKTKWTLNSARIAAYNPAACLTRHYLWCSVGGTQRCVKLY